MSTAPSTPMQRLQPSPRRRSRAEMAGPLLLMLLLLAGCARPARTIAFQFDHAYRGWNALVARHAHGEGFDYAAVAADPAPLDRFILDLQAVPAGAFDAWSREQRLAFLVNAHNAFAIHRIAARWPVDSLEQTRPLLRSAREERDIRLLGRRWSLARLEAAVMDSTLAEPRAIFLLNWGERTCAPPAPVAATPLNVHELAEARTRETLALPRHADYDWRNTVLYLTPLLERYRPDFEREYATLWDFLERHLPADSADRMRQRRPRLRFLPPDPTLNSAAP